MAEQTVSEAQAQAALDGYASKVTQDDVREVLDKEARIVGKVAAAGGPLRRFVGDIKNLFAMVRDYWSGNYRDIPWRTIAMAVGALVYVFSPIDLIPDIIPVVGLLDDALVVKLCLKAIRADLDAYLIWKAQAAH